MKRRLPARAFLGLAVTLALVWSASVALLRSAATPISARDAKYASAERLVFYRLEPGEVLRVALPPDAETLRLLTHLVLPPEVTYAPERQYVYGLELRLLGPEGEELLHRPLYTRTRQSKAQRVDGLWMQESAFTVDPEVQLTDGREFLTQLPPEVRARATTVQVSHPGPHGALLVRAYVRTAETPRPLASQRRTAAVRRAEARAERATFLPWEKLSVETQHQLVTERWERLGAEGEAAEDYRTLPVYRTDFRLPLVEVAEGAQERLEPGRAVALNLLGPVRPQLWLWTTPLEATGGAPGPVTVRALGADGTERTWQLSGPAPGEPTAHPLELPAGVHTLEVRNTGTQALRYTLEAPARHWLAPPELAARAKGPTVALLPDARRFEAYVSGPGCEALELEVEPGGDDASRLLRLDARGLGTPDPGAAPVALTLTLLDARGRTLGESRLDVAPEPAPFESAHLPQLPGGQLPCATAGVAPTPGEALEVTPRPASVSQPASARFFLPAGTRRVRLHASQPTALNLYTFLRPAGGARSAAPYLDEGRSEVRWRYEPLEQRLWHPLRPANHAALSARGARVELVSQVRLERGGAAVPVAPSGEAVSLKPQGSPPTHEFLEPDTTPDPEDAARALFAPLAPGRPARVRFDARTPTRPELRLRLEAPEGLGNEVEVLLNGAPLHRAVLRTTHARELLPPVPPGEHELLLRSSAPGLSATLNRPLASGSPPGLRMRTVYRLGEEGLRVPVLKQGPGAVTLNIVVYAPLPEASEGPRVAVTVDEGTPRRRDSIALPRLTRAHRELALPASEREPATSPAQPRARWYARTLSVRLGEDLAPGVHLVDVEPLGTGPLWARFFVLGEASTDTGPRQWTQPGWELEDAP